MTISPFIMGSGRAGQAIARSLACLAVTHPELKLAPAEYLPRGFNLKDLQSDHPLLIIANPPGLHCASLVAAHEAKIKAILCEKPSCVSLADVDVLKDVTGSIGIFHVYRQTWGLQTLKSMIQAGEFGELISIEGRYWQSSTAARALSAEKAPTWKNDITLSGASDVFLDIGCHWIDAVSYLNGSLPSSIHGWRSYANAEASHRESHVQVSLKFGDRGRALGSFSKTMHGATNHFEIQVIGSKGSASWTFLSPDEIFIGRGRGRHVLVRDTASLGSNQPAFHGLGWLEGYIEIAHLVIREAFFGETVNYPHLQENVAMIKSMLNTTWLD